MTTLLPTPQSEEEVKNLVASIEARYAEKKHPFGHQYALERLRTRIAATLTDILGEDPLLASDVTLAAVPAQHIGDFAIQVPHLMKDMKRYRGEILPQLKERLQAQTDLTFSVLELVGPFLNFSLAKHQLIAMALEEIESLGSQYGLGSSQREKRVIIEYSSPNMGKSLHVGHLGTTLVGQGLANLFEAAGAIVFRVSHLGDWGTPCGMLQVGYSLYANEPEIQSLAGRPSKFYSAIYSKFNEAQKENPELREQAKEAFARLEQGEEAALAFWKKVRAESAVELDRIYEGLSIHFDTYLGEAFYEPYLRNTIDELLQSDVATPDGPAVVVNLEDAGLKSVLLQKSDGATTYFARDVVALYKRKELFDYDLAAYIVGSEQTLHFRQLFELAKRMRYLGKASCVHVPIGLITQKGSKISSRAGGALGAEELQEAIFERAKSQVDESVPELTEEERATIAHQLTNGALFYNQLLTAPGKSTDFNLDNILDMRGKSGAYLQYACVRGRGILRKVGNPEIPLGEIQEELLNALDESALQMVKDSLLLPDVIVQCCEQKSPHPLAHYLHTIGQSINHFYQRIRIKELKSPEKDLYLHVLEKTVITLENGLRIMNIEVPDRM
ncbi:MAG: arginine--tRNA ligase [Bdellovibrionales bacterium]|nr:arginine--tRNA ligase [Bdellovibrionales bacterium]